MNEIFDLQAYLSAGVEQVVADGPDGDPEGETEIYITPLGGATSEFFRLEAR